MFNAAEESVGKWRGILITLGIDEKYLQNKHGACPFCGGIDRWRFDNKGGKGTYYCNACGSGDGFGFLMKLKGWDFRETAKQIEKIITGIEPEILSPKDIFQKMELIKKIFNESKIVEDGDPVWKYLNARTGIQFIPKDILYHERLKYYDENTRTESFHPAMLAIVKDVNGSGLSIHRTYLTNEGCKANVPTVKKMMAGKPITGGAIRLSKVQEKLGVAEGIETAFAASLRFGVPVWSVVSAGMMEAWQVPVGVKEVVIMADADSNFVGQSAAYKLAARLVRAKLKVEVVIPGKLDTDWADYARE